MVALLRGAFTAVRAILNWRSLAAFFCAAAIFAGVYFAVTAIHGQRELQKGIDIQALASARADCRFEISVKYGEASDLVVDLRAESQLLLNRALINNFVGIRAGQEDYEQFVETDKQLAAAKARRDALPPVDSAVDNGFYLDGVKYPPCPKVSK